MKVYSLEGTLIVEQVVESKIRSVEITFDQQLAPGIYPVVIESKQNQKHHKLMVR